MPHKTLVLFAMLQTAAYFFLQFTGWIRELLRNGRRKKLRKDGAANQSGTQSKFPQGSLIAPFEPPAKTSGLSDYGFGGKFQSFNLTFKGQRTVEDTGD